MVVGEIAFPTPDGKVNNPLQAGYGFYKDDGGVMWLVIGKVAILADGAEHHDGTVFARRVSEGGDYLPYTARIVTEE